jgi:hypothetical protein
MKTKENQDENQGKVFELCLSLPPRSRKILAKSRRENFYFLEKSKKLSTELSTGSESYPQSYPQPYIKNRS